ncbi:uncharacterized protein LOC114517267 [Dendronephthya gigantea]|uniref:uncharacterized protein LOC114517267 n=1 Tax=Dendronephthya gigantea TaxID=151771 RepID=UPI0010692898|nr:uncharacterized protein LOC114517267 [Dendronephthya gigantea]
MQVFFEVKVSVRILYVATLFLTVAFAIEGAKINCIKVDECSCKTSGDSEPLEKISLWSMPSRGHVEASGSWLFAFNLCHGVNKNSDVPDGGCLNSTVCQYTHANKNETFEIGKFGNATFGQYDNETKSITLIYYGTYQENSTRSINITLKCDENVTVPDYGMVNILPLNPNRFKTTITAKAACLRTGMVPYPTSANNSVTSNGGGLKTVYIVLITIGGIVILLAVSVYVAYKVILKRKRSLLLNEEEIDYGAVPKIHAQNVLSTPVGSGPV